MGRKGLVGHPDLEGSAGDGRKRRDLMTERRA
jgi:hypothetical protein